MSFATLMQTMSAALADWLMGDTPAERWAASERYCAALDALRATHEEPHP